jgi:hypothetical protein
MISLLISVTVFICVGGFTLAGVFLRNLLPEHHLSGDSKDMVKVAVGLIATMTAILLGLLIASAKGFSDTQNNELIELSAKVILLDRMLARYGQQSKEARNILATAVHRSLEAICPPHHQRVSSPPPGPAGGEMLYEEIESLSPVNDAQRTLKPQALSLAVELAKTRWLMFQQAKSFVSIPLLTVVVCWLCLIFCSFGLLAPRNATVLTALGLSVLSVSLAVFLIAEMYNPFRGVMHISCAPLRSAVEHLGK